MTQGTAIQALARATRVFPERARRYRRTAVRALGAFRAPPPIGVRVAAPGGSHYLMYSFSPGLRILNGDLQAITGLRDLAVLGRSRAARVLFRRGERAARAAVAGYDTGAWSLYSQNGRESTLSYHQLVGTFLGNLCRRTDGRTYCSAHRRFARYEREPPRIRLARLNACAPSAAPRCASRCPSSRRCACASPGAEGVAMARDMSVSRGTYTVPWTPPRRGRYRVRIAAQGPSGPIGVRSETVSVRMSERRAQRRRAQRRGAAARARRRRAKRRARGAPSGLQAGDRAVAEGVHEAAVIVAGELAVGRAEVGEVGGERVVLVADRLARSRPRSGSRRAPGRSRRPRRSGPSRSPARASAAAG